MLALAAYRASLCPSCGQPQDICSSAESEDRWTSPLPARCHATVAIAINRERYRDDPHPQTLLFHAERKGR